MGWGGPWAAAVPELAMVAAVVAQWVAAMVVAVAVAVDS